MGKSHHRKQIPLGRGSRTRGVGVSYHDVVPARSPELTPAELEARQQAKASAEELRGLRAWNVRALMHVAGFAVDVWEDSEFQKRGMALDDELFESVVLRAMAAANTAITRHCDNEGIDVSGLLNALSRPRTNPELQSALAHVHDRVARLFEKLQEGSNPSRG